MLKKIFLFAAIGVLGIASFASAATLAQRLSGTILLQVEDNGEAWYVDPVTLTRVYMKDGSVAYSALREFGLGITNADLNKIPVGVEARFSDVDTDGDGLSDKLEDGLKTDLNKADTDGDGVSDGREVLTNNTNPLGQGNLIYNTALITRLKGRILLQVESHGEAWYVYPKDGKRYYMKDGDAAYQIMRFLSLGITNNDLSLIPINKTFETSPTSETTPTAAPTATPISSIKFEGRYIDVHAHITPSAMSLADTIKNMDAQGIDMMVIMKPPAAIVDTPQSTSGIPDASEQYPNKFISLYGGEAVTMLEKAATSGSYTKADEEKYASLLETEMKSGQYKGFGEIGLRHFVPTGDKNPVAYDLTIPGDHPWMFIMSDIAAKYDVPIDVHMEATDVTVKGLETLLDYNKNTKIIWDHASWSNTDLATPQLISQLMDKHLNLYSSIKIRPENSASAVYIYDNNGQITPEWLTLLKKYPGRFMIGSDIKPGRNVEEFLLIETHRDFLEQLPPEILKAVERDNAIKLFKIN